MLWPSSLPRPRAERLDSIKRIYLSVGADESWEMLKAYGILRDALHKNGFGESKLKTEIIQDAGHVGAMPIALYNGLRFLFSQDAVGLVHEAAAGLDEIPECLVFW